MDERTSLADALQAHLLEIEHRWLLQVTQEGASRGVSLTELRNAMPEYLDSLVEALRNDCVTVAAGAKAAWARLTREHALTRVRLGFDVDELVHEFILLRHAIFEVLDENQVFRSSRQAMLLADLIEAAIVLAVQRYIESRDYYSRLKEAEHIGFITHELRNPLTTAKLAATQMRRVSTGCAPDQERMLNSLERNLDRLSRLIDSTLLTERLEAGEAICNPVATTIGQILDVALSAAQGEALAKGVEFVVEANPDVRLEVDVSLTISAVQNLVDNAVKFTDSGRVVVVVEVLAEQVAVHVWDTCHGLSEQELRTIFLPFRRGHHGKRGAGLGLAIAKRAVEAQGGSIDAESLVDAGCHFRMILPRSPARRVADGVHPAAE